VRSNQLSYTALFDTVRLATFRTKRAP